ncbi:MAG: hypothetical protein OEY88_03575 [Candidatus Bathyarchaeota archaeon]|nr:hypothetical protein [Candidatus Bathyarchaeota archaeon]
MLYTLRAHTVARRISEEFNYTVWGSRPSGSLFPCPREPGPVRDRSSVNEVDRFIYRYLIKTWGLAGLSILAWIGTGLFMLKSITRKQGLKVLS